MPALYDQILCFGDSITQNSFNPGRGFGFSAALQTAYIRKLDVVNRGQSGYNTRQALKVLSTVIPSPQEARIRFLVIFFGANDAALKSVSNQHVPLEEYLQNIETIVKHPLVQAHNPRIILVTPPPINEHLWWPNDREKGFASVSRVAATTKSYADAVCELGQKLNVPVANLWKAIMAKTNFQSDTWKVGGEAIPGSLEAPLNDELVRLMYDGLHLDIAGYDILYEELMKIIGQTWSDQLPGNLPNVLPEWKDEEAWAVWEEARATQQPNGQGP